MQTLAKGLEILALFRPDRHTLTVEQIAAELDLPKSSTYRLVRTLRQTGYLRKSGRDGYTLDTRLLRFGEVVRATSRVHDLAQPYMEELVRASQESAALVLRSGDRASVVAKVDSPQTIKLLPETGWSYPLHAGAAGKVFLANMPRAELRRYLARPLEHVTEQTVVEPEPLEAQLEQIRSDGYAVIEEELIPGGVSLAAPVLDADGTVAACLSVAGPRARFTIEAAIAVAPAMRDCAQRMSAELGAAPERLASA